MTLEQQSKRAVTSLKLFLLSSPSRAIFLEDLFIYDFQKDEEMRKKEFISCTPLNK